MPDRRLARLLAVAAMATIALGGTACSSEPERSVANYCSQIDTLRTIDEDLAAGDPVRIQARAEDLRLLRQVSPPEIEPSVAILLGVTEDFARTAGTATDRSAVADEVFRGRSGDVASIEAAGNDVSAYTRDNCGVDLGGGSTSTPGSTSGAGTDPTTTAAGGGPSTPTSGGGTGATTTTSTPSLLVP